MKKIYSLILMTTISYSAFTQNYQLKAPVPFVDIKEGDAIFADVDNDNDEDIFLCGATIANNPISKLYINDGNGNYSTSSVSFEFVKNSSAAFADVNNDGFQDLLVTGSNSTNQKIANLYINDGTGSFTLNTGTPFTGVSNGDVAFADVDGDNDQDVMITGSNSSFLGTAELYLNDGSGIFSLVSGTPFPPIQNTAIAFADVDNDSDNDLLLTGQSTGTFTPVTSLFENDGTGNFSLVIAMPFDSVANGSVAFSDIDGDNYKDVLITGITAGNQRVSKLYKNDATIAIGYTLDTGTPFSGVYAGGCAFVDVLSTGNQDVLITGLNSSNQRIAEYYSNDGSGNFTLDTGTPFTAVQTSSIAFADIDGDNDQDVLITGRIGNTAVASSLYQYCIPIYGVDLRTECSPFVWIDGNTYTANNNSATHTINNGGFDGCDSIITLNLSILPSSSGMDFQTACNSYTWIDGNTYTANNSSATHNIIGGASNGCDSLVFLDLTINTADVTTINSNDSITANATGALYQWLDCDNNYSVINGETNALFIAASNGNYAVEVTENGCVDTSSCTDITGVGVTESFNFDRVSIYPNPNKGLFTISLDKLKEGAKIIVFTIVGKELINEKIKSTNTTIDIGFYDKGIYFVKIKNGNQTITKRIIKQ